MTSIVTPPSRRHGMEVYRRDMAEHPLFVLLCAAYGAFAAGVLILIAVMTQAPH